MRGTRGPSTLRPGPGGAAASAALGIALVLLAGCSSSTDRQAGPVLARDPDRSTSTTATSAVGPSAAELAAAQQWPLIDDHYLRTRMFGLPEKQVTRSAGGTLTIFSSDQAGQDVAVVDDLAIDATPAISARRAVEQKARSEHDHIIAGHPTTFRGHPAYAAEVSDHRLPGVDWVFSVQARGHRVLVIYFDTGPVATTTPFEETEMVHFLRLATG